MSQASILKRGVNSVATQDTIVASRNLLDVLRMTNYLTGDIEQVTGVNASPVLLDLSKATEIRLVSSGSGSAHVNAFKLPAGFYGQEVKVILKTLGNAGDTVTLVEGAGVVALALAGGAYASATFSAVNKYIVLKFQADGNWHVIGGDATVA